MTPEQITIAVLTSQRNQALDALTQTGVQLELANMKIKELEDLVKDLQRVGTLGRQET